jgi:hypothetical protein
MATRPSSSPKGERPEPSHPAEYVRHLSAIDPLPFFPNLARALRGPTNALVLTYLEMLHPAPQDLNGRIVGPSVALDCDQICEDLQISRRTLHIALSCLGTWWRTEEARGRAERVGRAFLNLQHSLHGSVKFYSIVGPQGWRPGSIVIIKRNAAHLQSLLQRVFLLDWPQAVIDPTQTHESHSSSIMSAGPSLSSLLSLPEILRVVLPDWGDRRAERWDRWRREHGRKPTNVSRMRMARSASDVGTPSE